MTSHAEVTRVVSATREIAAGPEEIFEFIADPAQQPRWDGNENLAAAPAGQRVRRAGEVFLMTLTGGAVRENHVVEFDEGRRMAWKPASRRRSRPGICGDGILSDPAHIARGSRAPTTGPG